jgi:hypothetical protein
MKTTIFILLFTVFSFISTQAQHSNFIRLSVDAGLVVNTERDNQFGMGGTLSWFIQDNLFSFNPDNYISIGITGFNNPYGEGKLIGSILNDKKDGFNYIMPLLGYRITQQGIADGFFAEPRMGIVIGSGYTGFAFSPLAGYAYRNFDFSLFCDMGFSDKVSFAMRKKNFFTPGISIGYNIGI